MKRRIERAIEQRTTMLNGVSHDLRTVLTRFKLSLALMGDSEETQELQKDVAEMQRMLEAYLAFARGAAGESAAKIDMIDFLEELRFDAVRAGSDVKIAYSGRPASSPCGRTRSSAASPISSAMRRSMPRMSPSRRCGTSAS